MKSLIIYVHGKGGNVKEVNHYKPLFKNSDVIGFDYESQNPWDAKVEFSSFYDRYSKNYDSVILIANSIGAFFSMNALNDKNIEKAYFISPIVNMEHLILNMMKCSNVTEKELEQKGEIITEFEETLSWEYLCYVRKNKEKWDIPTSILYGANDNLTSLEDIKEFANKTCSRLTIMEDGEHWFHTDLQMEFLDNWLKEQIIKH